jgi:hypothetical protein
MTRYEPAALLHHLLQWYNNGQGTTRPELMGCCHVPDVGDVYACQQAYG